MIPLELIDLICNKINLKLLVKISTGTLFQINRKKIEKYWKNEYREPYWKKEYIKNIIENGDIQGIKNILNLNIKHDINNYLILASENGQLEIIKYLVSLGADITAENNEAVIMASEYGHLDTVKHLVENGADITAQNDISIFKAVEWGHLEMVKYLIEIYNNFGEKIIGKNSLRLIILKLIPNSKFEKHVEMTEYLNSLLNIYI